MNYDLSRGIIRNNSVAALDIFYKKEKEVRNEEKT